jgi:hypothetical protein
MATEKEKEEENRKEKENDSHLLGIESKSFSLKTAYLVTGL